MGTIPFPARVATLLREIDKRMMVSLRDGRILIGFLRTIDQFANLVLHKTVERVYVGNKYGDIPRGIFIIRGENVLLMGEVDPFHELTQPLVQVPVEEILDLRRIEREKRKEHNQLLQKLIKDKSALKSTCNCEDVY